jgi:MFS transporter, PAT family, beta-lactamase induction signal transducer AmpG
MSSPSSPSLLSIIKSRRVWLLAALGFASGLPLWLVGVTLSAWMKNEGVNLKTIGIFGLASMPYTLKVLWAPLLDRYTLPYLGRRRGWMVTLQVALIGGIAAMGTVNPKDSPFAMACLALLVSFFAASHDVVADAWRTDSLPPEERALGTATFVTGYRMGMLVAGAGALTMSDLIGWPGAYYVMSSLMLVGVVATLLAPEPQGTRPPRTLVDAVVLPFVDYFRRRGAVGVLLFLVAYKLGDAIASGMTTPFYIELGFTNTEIGWLSKGLGMGATIAGGLLSGLLMPKLGMRRALYVFGALQALTNLTFLALALVGKNHLMLAVAITVDQLCGGLAVTAFAAYLMSLCNKSFSATQYALLSSLGTVGNRVISAASGYLAEALGWPGFFAFTVVLAAPALILLAFLPKDAAMPVDEQQPPTPSSPEQPQQPTRAVAAR